MENNAVFVLIFCLAASQLGVSKTYRSDYEYNAHTDAFYKLHVESRRGWAVNSVCEVEGGSLMAPLTQEDIIQVHGMFKNYPDLGQYVWVASDGRDHESAEEPAIINLTNPNEDSDERISLYSQHGCDVLTRSGEIESLPCYREMPFVCKVEAKDTPYDPHCDVMAKDYQYNATIGSCYKIPRWAASWNEAYEECRAEGSHLVIINSEVERVAVQRLMQESPRLPGVQASWFFFAGFRTTKPVGNETLVWKTVFNQTLTEAGFAEWSPGEPNNAQSNEFCGTLFKNDGKLNDLFCDNLYAFICEKEVRTSA